MKDTIGFAWKLSLCSSGDLRSIGSSTCTWLSEQGTVALALHQYPLHHCLDDQHRVRQEPLMAVARFLASTLQHTLTQIHGRMFVLLVTFMPAVILAALARRDHLMCAMAAELLQAGRASMRMAVDWLKQGLPFKPSFAVTHITELCSSRTGGHGGQVSSHTNPSATRADCGPVS